MKSLRSTLLAWLLGAVLVIGLAGGYLIYRNALAEANAFFDYHLRATALLLRDQAYGFAPAPGLPREVPDYDFVVQVWTVDGRLVYVSDPQAHLPSRITLGFSTETSGDGRFRTFSVVARDYLIQVAQPLGERERRAARRSRSAIGCATWIRYSRATTLNVRKRPSPLVSVENPSVMRDGRCACGSDR